MEIVMKVEVRSRQTVNQWDSDGDVAVISVSDPDLDHPFLAERPNLKEVLRLTFHDVDASEVGENSPFNHRLMTDEDGKRIAEFVEKHKDVDLMIAQCDAGICRSSGIAAAILMHLTGDDSTIFNDRRYYPNRWVYKKTLEALRN